MRISFSPQFRDDALAVSKTGDILTINGDTIDFSIIPDGATVNDAREIHPFLTGKIERIDGVINLTFLMPYIADGRIETPALIIVTADGSITLPEITNG